VEEQSGRKRAAIRAYDAVIAAWEHADTTLTPYRIEAVARRTYVR
jgi:hypothetical protein